MGLLGALFGIKDSEDYLKIIQSVSQNGGRGIIQTPYAGFAGFLLKNMDEFTHDERDSIGAVKYIDGKQLVVSLQRERKDGVDTGRCILAVVAEK